MSSPDLSGARWHTSSYSSAEGQNGDCVEVAALPAAVAFRDSKSRGSAPYVVTPAAWTAFLDGVRAGEFDRR